MYVVVVRERQSPSSAWEELLPPVIYGYHQHTTSNGILNLLVDVRGDSTPCGMRPLGASPAGTSAEPGVGTFTVFVARGTKVRDGKEMRIIGTRAVTSFRIEDRLLVGKGNAVGALTKWTVNKSKFFGPCRIVSSNHARYGLVFPKKRLSRKDINARRLNKFTQRPSHIQ